jgi:hypothetical protein
MKWLATGLRELENPEQQAILLSSALAVSMSFIFPEESIILTGAGNWVDTAAGRSVSQA